MLSDAMSHLLRRAGFGVGLSEVDKWRGMDVQEAINTLVNFEAEPDDVDSKIGDLKYMAVADTDSFDQFGKLTKGRFNPNKNLVDAMQRWVFRMVHTRRPLQEKMTIFWHNHFATGRTKVSEKLSFSGAVRAFSAKPTEDADRALGQIELFRNHALGNFRDMLRAVARDPAMIAWLDGDTNIVGRPQENFARELMELFTIGVDGFTEEDVYGAARVFTGWNLEPISEGAKDVHYRGFKYYPEAHDTGYKEFSFKIYPDGGKRIPARDAESGFQDGLDLLDALAAHPATGKFLAKKLYAFFVNDQHAPDEELVEIAAKAYYQSGFEIREVVRQLLQSPQFFDSNNHWARYSWPAEYVARLIKEVGWVGFSADQAALALVGMGQALFDPPSVAGWHTGKAWFSTTTMLARMNFAMTLCWNQQLSLSAESEKVSQDPDAFLSYFLSKMTCKPFDKQGLDSLRAYLVSDGTWTRSPSQIKVKAAGLAHLIGASSEYQFI